MLEEERRGSLGLANHPMLSRVHLPSNKLELGPN